MNMTKGWDWLVLDIGFWLGVFVISLINIGLIVLNHHQLQYDIYILIIAIIAAFGLTLLKIRHQREES
jgi:hypothetical protein